MWRLSYGVLSELAKEQLIAQQPAKWREMLPRSPMPEEYDKFIDQISSNNLRRSSNNDPKKHRAEISFIALMDEAGTEKAKVKELLPGITLSNVRPYVKATSYYTLSNLYKLVSYCCVLEHFTKHVLSNMYVAVLSLNCGHSSLFFFFL